MANLSKKWGAVIGCWAVALVLIVTGICLGLTIPSSAADEDAYEGDIAVTFDADGDGEYSANETTVYHTLNEMVDAVNALATTAEKPVTIQMQSDVIHNGSIEMAFRNKQVIWDLNGHYLSTTCISHYDVFLLGNINGSLKFTDSNPEAVHYCSFVPNGVVDTGIAMGTYKFSDYEKNGEPSTLIRGGVIASSILWLQNLAKNDAGDNIADDISLAQIELSGGTFVAQSGIVMNLGKLVINDGVTWQVATENGELIWLNVGDVGKIQTAITTYANGVVEINGGSIYGDVWHFDKFDYSDGEEMTYTTVNLAEPQAEVAEYVKVNANMKQVEIDGVKVYTVVDAEDKPVTTPTDPIKESDPTKNNNNMLGIIVLGAASVVMIAGVGTAIGIAVKRRKRKAA